MKKYITMTVLALSCALPTRAQDMDSLHPAQSDRPPRFERGDGASGELGRYGPGSWQGRGSQGRDLKRSRENVGSCPRCGAPSRDLDTRRFGSMGSGKGGEPGASGLRYEGPGHPSQFARDGWHQPRRLGSAAGPWAGPGQEERPSRGHPLGRPGMDGQEGPGAGGSHQEPGNQ